MVAWNSKEIKEVSMIRFFVDFFQNLMKAYNETR